MRNIGERFGLGVSLAIMLLLAGKAACVPVGWIATALLVISLVRSKLSYKEMYVNGLVCYSIGLFWIWSMIGYLSELNALWVSFIFLIFVAANALFLPAMQFLYRALPKYLDRLALRSALACVSIEWLPLSLFPWRIGHSQWWFTTFIQIADLGGVLLISFVMVWLVEAFYRGAQEHHKHLVFLSCAILFSVLSYGAIRIHEFECDTKKQMMVSLVQASKPKESESEPNNQQLFAKLQSLTQEIHDPSDLIIWPETSLPFLLHESVFDKRNEPRLPIFSKKINLLIGAKTYRRPNRVFNSAVLIATNGKIPLPYHKRLPIPFGEYIPYESSFPILRYVHPSTKNIDRGSELRIFEIPLTGARGTARIAPFLCYEEIFPAFGIEAVQKGANLLAGISDDSWNGPTFEVPLRQHFALSAFRSVELRRSFIRTTGTGITAAIDPIGRVMASLPPNQDGVITEQVQLHEPNTLYVLLGGDRPWCMLACLSFLVGLFNIWRRARAPLQ